MTRRSPVWDLPHLRSHLQSVVDLELWTVPFYMSAMYSIQDPACKAYQLIQASVHEEMLHVQLSCNLANAFGLRPRFKPPVYQGKDVPHLDFALDTPNPTMTYTPFSAEIGPLDAERINTMCLIEYPEWDTERMPDLHEDCSAYGSIAEFYNAVRYGMYQLREQIRGGKNQIEEFRFYYDDLPGQAITFDGDDGYRQALGLIDLITDQGEGQSQGDTPVAPEHQNTADGFHESWSHFKRFSHIREMSVLPTVYQAVRNPASDSPGERAQQRLADDFAQFMRTLDSLFGDGHRTDFGPLMARIGGDILTCWQLGAIPRFS